jgi:glycosyltransferase involved in cell wall biosynthesis
MQSKLISVIMPAYNREKFIKQAIDSILNQTYTNFEILISKNAV